MPRYREFYAAFAFVALTLLLARLAVFCHIVLPEDETWHGEPKNMNTAMKGKALTPERAVDSSAGNGVEYPDERGKWRDAHYMRREEFVPGAYRATVDAFIARHDISIADTAQYASDMNDVMDEMLNRSEIPADYAETMVALFRDKLRGDVVRDFAVQHIGLYAETLNMRGKYDADSSESATLRDALFDAAEETSTIVAAAAFRALADMAAFDPHIDVSRLDSRLAACLADSSASPAARVMAAQLCGERHVVAAKPVLARIASDRREPDPLRLAAANSAKLLSE